MLHCLSCPCKAGTWKARPPPRAARAGAVCSTPCAGQGSRRWQDPQYWFHCVCSNPVLVSHGVLQLPKGTMQPVTRTRRLGGCSSLQLFRADTLPCSTFPHRSSKAMLHCYLQSRRIRNKERTWSEVSREFLPLTVANNELGFFFHF